MKFAHPLWLTGTVVAVVVAVLLISGGLLLLRAMKRFGDEPRVMALVTGRAGPRRSLKGALLVLGVAAAFVALAQPQYGKGTRVIPATNLDVVLVLDFSKSMYAGDIAPSRIERAKGEVSRLIRQLPGARFGAVAFAGEPMSFPLTSDGGAIAQFFRQLTPNDLPVGGTAIGRALEAGRELLERDPLSAKHRRVMVLVTDGEDLEGDPVSVAEAAAGEGIAVHVVQIGGRSPEPIPEYDDTGQKTGWRTDEQGNPLTTSLSAEGEAQLGRVADKGGGRLVRSQGGSTGIDTVAAALRRMMTEELSEKVETIYADVYYYPLAAALVLLLIETFVSEVPRPRRRKDRGKASPTAEGAATWVGLGALVLTLLVGCHRATDRLFERNAPEVDQAIGVMDAGDASAAVDLLEQYLSTGKCDSGKIGTPDRVRERPSAAFDLGLGLFRIAEQFGQRWSELSGPSQKPSGAESEESPERRAQIDCALSIVELVAADPNLPAELRARANYLAGNLKLLRGDYAGAIEAYDRSLRIIPGVSGDAGDPIGRDAAWNRAIALRYRDQEPPPDAGQDGSKEDSPDADQKDSGQDASADAGPPDSGPPDASDSGQDSGGNDSNDAGEPPEPKSDDAGEQDGSADHENQQQNQPPPPAQDNSASQNDRILDMLEQAPTLQEHDAKRWAGRTIRRSSEDK
ncbi:MAG: VWA domain-containing protein [Polyangiaceae bacterium]|nr:VWA domain-containing protein [Polyangiaceae bacterium]